MKQGIILFGAGLCAQSYKSLLDFLGIPIAYIVDNDKSKWGGESLGISIISPENLLALNMKILIATSYEKEGRKQLEVMGLSECILELEDLKEEFLNKLKQLSVKRWDFKEKKAKYVFLDIYEGSGWGGTEIWSATVAKGLQKIGYNVKIIGSCKQPVLSMEHEKRVKRLETSNVVGQMVSYFMGHMPVVYFNNFSGCGMLTAIMLKLCFPQSVHIIDVLHNDRNNLIDAHMMYRRWINSYICVSARIRDNLINLYEANEEEVYYKEQPIDVLPDLIRKYSGSREPLQIGYGARLSKEQKRADLLPDFINKLEKKGILYHLNVAGDGELKEYLTSYIKENNIDNKIHILGRIPQNQMLDFWKKQDIYLNFSEYEGASLAMLEAMGCGCVPVVTFVSGVAEFVKDSYNGYVREIGDMDGLVAAMAVMDDNREKLKEFGSRCRMEIVSRCRQEDYITFIRQIIDGK